MNYRTPAAHAIDSFSSAPSHFANSLLKTTLLERTAMPGRNQQNSRRFLATFARWAISATLITVIVWWLGGLGKIAAIAGRINFGLGLAVVPVMILDRLSMTYKQTLSRRDPSLPEL